MVSKKIVQDLIKNNRPRFVEPGEYLGYITNVEQRENEKGTDWIAITCNSDEIGKVYLRYFFTDRAAKRAFRDLHDLAREFDLKIDLEQFEVRDLEYLCDLFGSLCGREVMINITGKLGNFMYKLNKVV
jgi:hypothetical protein